MSPKFQKQSALKLVGRIIQLYFYNHNFLKANKLYAPKSRENPQQKKQQNFIEQAT
jgi:sulfur relay (sulfurtransferase) complex TusBCD TusD component (DsrE family)